MLRAEPWLLADVSASLRYLWPRLGRRGVPINDVGLPLHFHHLPVGVAEARASYTGLTRRALPLRYTRALCLFQMTLANILTALMGRAVFERYPNIRVAFGERWHRLDSLRARPHGFRIPRTGVQDLPLEDEAERVLAPAVQGHVPVPIALRHDQLIDDAMGVLETLTVGVRLPHPDGVWPRSRNRTYIADQFLAPAGPTSPGR